MATIEQRLRQRAVNCNNAMSALDIEAADAIAALSRDLEEARAKSDVLSISLDGTLDAYDALKREVLEALQRRLSREPAEQVSSTALAVDGTNAFPADVARGDPTA